MSILDLIRADLKTFSAYQATPRHFSADEVWLNANESPFTTVHQELRLNRYPEQQPQNVLDRIARLYQVEADEIVLTRGSDELIDLLIRLFCRAEHDAVMVCPPTFFMYTVCAKLQGANVIEVPLKKENFALDMPAIQAAWNEQVKLIFLCSPNNPTGNLVSKEDVYTLCEQYKNKSLIIVDEAYIEFAQQPSFVSSIKQFDNLLVLRTFSKAYGLAGIRCGMGFAQKSLVRALLSILAPYPLPAYVADVVLQVLSSAKLKDIKNQIATILVERERLINAFQDHQQIAKVWPSAGNFLLVDFHDKESVVAALSKANIFIRNFTGVGALANSARITVGSPDENNKLLAVLQSLR